MKNPAPVDASVHELIRERWSPRAFASRAVDRETLRSLFVAAQWAPSSYNEQPWSFIVATREQPAEHERLLACLVPDNQSWARAAPVLILTIVRSTFDRNGKANRHAHHDLGLAAAQLTLQATACDLVVHQMAGFDPDQARRKFQIPADWEPLTVIAVGYPGEVDSLPEPVRQAELASRRRRRPLAELVFAGTWGQAAAVVR